MALSGSFYSYPVNSFGLYCSWSAKQSISGYYSDVTVNVYVSHYSLTAGSRTNSTIKCGSETYTYTSPSLSYPSGTALTKTLIGSKTFRVYHDNGGGAKSVVVSASWAFNGTYSGTYVGTVTASSTLSLDAIPQQSAIASVSVDGSNKVTVNITRYVSTFTHTVKFVFGSYSHTVGEVGTSTSYTIPLSWLNAIPNSITGVGAVQVTTYSGGSKVGNTVSREFVVTVPNTVVPSIGGISWAKTSSEPNIWPITKEVSTGTMTMTGVTGAYGSTIVSHSLTFAGLSSNTPTLVVNGVNTYGTLNAVAKVTDSRGRSTTKTVAFTVSDYSKPTLEVVAFRCNNLGQEDAEGDSMFVKATASVAVVGNNILDTLMLYYKKKTDSTYMGLELTSGDENILSSISSDSTWEWYVVAADWVNSVTVSGSIPTADVVFDILANGKGIKFGGVAEKEGMSSAWDLELPNINATNKLKGASVEGTTGSFTNLTVGGVSATFVKNIKDFVVEQGTSGIWTYRKWNSGVAECWGLYNREDLAITTAWGYIYESGEALSARFPEGLFVDVPVFNMNIQYSSAGVLSLETVSNVNKEMTCYIYPTRATPATVSITIAMRAIGRWK